MNLKIILIMINSVENLVNSDKTKSVEKPKGIARRSFFKVSGAALFAFFITACDKNSISNSPLPEKPVLSASTPSIPSQINSNSDRSESISAERILVPQIIDGVEVYGLDEHLQNEAQLLAVYKSFDDKFAKDKGIEIVNKVEQRKQLLNLNTRYLEVVVRRSAYDSFLKRQPETQVSFIDWIKMHVDTMNITFDNAIPSIQMRTVLNRIIVIDDSFTKDFYSNEDKHKPSSDLDFKWRFRYKGKLPIDTDCSWAIADDDRPFDNVEIDRTYYWRMTTQNGIAKFGFPARTDNFTKTYEFSALNTSLLGRTSVLIDFALIHEWSHYLWNLPDEYVHDIHDSKQRYTDFFFRTGLYLEPNLSQYLAYFARRNIELKKRDTFVESRIVDVGDRPDKISIEIKGRDIPVNSIEVRRVLLKDNNVFSQEKSFNTEPDQTSSTSSVIFKEELFKGNSNVWLLKCKLSDGTSVELYLPYAVLAISRAASILDAKYIIEVIGKDDPSKKAQGVKLVEDSNIEKFIKDSNNKSDTVLAKMKIEGSSTWLVWFKE